MGHSDGYGGECNRPGCDDSHDWKDRSSGNYWGGVDDPNDKGGCFPATAMISTPSGKVKIGDLEVGDTVLSYTKDGGICVERITRKLIRTPKCVLEVVFEGGANLHATANHRFLSAKGWKRLDELASGDKIMTQAGFATIACIERMSKVEPVMNLYTTGSHTFIADGCVAHNFTHLRSIRTLFHRLFIDREFATAVLQLRTP